MNDPRKWVDGPERNLKRLLFRSGEVDVPPEGARERALGALWCPLNVFVTTPLGAPEAALLDELARRYQAETHVVPFDKAGERFLPALATGAVIAIVEDTKQAALVLGFGADATIRTGHLSGDVFVEAVVRARARAAIRIDDAQAGAPSEEHWALALLGAMVQERAALDPANLFLAVAGAADGLGQDWDDVSGTLERVAWLARCDGVDVELRIDPLSLSSVVRPVLSRLGALLIAHAADAVRKVLPTNAPIDVRVFEQEDVVVLEVERTGPPTAFARASSGLRQSLVSARGDILVDAHETRTIVRAFLPKTLGVAGSPLTDDLVRGRASLSRGRPT